MKLHQPTKFFLRLTLSFILLTILLVSRHSSAYASTITVTTTANSGAGSLRQALVDATAGDVITFDASLTGQTITLASELSVATPLTIDGSTTPNVTVSGNNHVRVFDASAPLTLIGFTVANGQAPLTFSGGGIATNNALTLTLMHIIDNEASYGGGIYSSNGNLVINQSTLSGNIADNAGGGLDVDNTSVTISNSAIYSNTANEDGAGLQIDGGSLLLENSTVSGNQATQNGGGVWISNTDATLRYSTLTNNEAGSSGGGLYVQGASNVVLDSSVIANSQNGGDCVGTVSGPGYNLIEDAANACGLTDGLNHNFVGVDPTLTALGNYGGPTWTHIHLNTGNLPDHGNPATCPGADQRGSVRPTGLGCDIGAIEADLAPTFNAANPANGTTDVAANGNLVFQFSEAVTAPDAAFSLQCPTGTPVTFAVAGSGSATVTLDPTNDLPAGVTCTWAITGNQITDVDSNDPPDSLTASPTGSFTLAALVDTAPAVTGVIPANGAVGVDTANNIVFSFSEPVTGPTSGISIECPVGTPIGFEDSGADTATRILSPNDALPANTTCQVTIQADAIFDMDNIDPPDHLVSNYTTSFTTAGSVDSAPAVISVTPANGTTDIDVNSYIAFTFSEDVTGPASGFRIECPVGTPIAFTDVDENFRRTLFPSSALPANTTCQVTIQAAAISDIDNIDPPDHLANDYTLSFTTAAPTSPTLPNIFGTPNDQVVAGQVYSFQPGAVDADGDPLTFSIQNKPAWASFDPANGLLSGTPQATNAGTTTGIVVSVSDGVHSVALPPFNLTVVATNADVNESPVLNNAQAPLQANVGQLYYFNPEGFDPDGDALSYTIENKPSWASFNAQTGVLQGTPTANDAGMAENITIRVSEAASVQAASLNAVPSASTTFNIQVNDPTSPIRPKSLSFCISDPAVVEAQEVVIKVQKAWEPYWGLFGDGGIESKKEAVSDTYVLTIKPNRNLLNGIAGGFLSNPYVTIMKPTFYAKQDLELPVSVKLDPACAKPNLLLLSRKQLGFTAVLGNDAQLSQSFTLEGSTETNLPWTAKVEPLGDSNSITLSPATGTTKKGNPNTLQINLSPNAVTTGPKTAKVVITDGNKKTYEIVVEYEVKTESNSVDMSLTALEVTQGMQNQRNAMPLVQDRPTFVRAHVQSKTGAVLNKATAKLLIKDGNNTLLGTLYPANEGMSINVVPNPDRSKLNDSFLFQLKPEWLNRTLVLEFAGNSNRAECKDINNTANDCRVTVNFIKVPPLPVKFFLCTQTYQEGGVTKTYSGTMEEAQQMIQLLETFFPTPKVSATTAPWSVNQKILKPLSSAFGAALSDLQKQWQKDGSPQRHYIALCTQPELGGALANLDNTTTTDRLDNPQAVFSSLGATITAHEFEHNYGYSHPGETGGRFYPDYAKNSSISEKTDPANPDTYYGFVIKNNLFAPDVIPYGKRVIPPTGSYSKDPVAYGYWLSDYTYREILGLMQTVYPASSQTIASASTTAETPVTFVSGWVTSTTSGQLSTVSGQVAQAAISLPTAGEYALRLERANGSVVQTIPFSLQSTPAEATQPAGVQAAASTALGAFNFAIPYELNKDSEIAKLVLLHQGTELDSITAPAAGAPDISGLLLSSHTSTVTADSFVNSNLRLHYWLEYQPAGSTTWSQVGSGDATPDATGQAAFTLVIEKASLPGADNHRWRLLVSNGFYTSRTEISAAFNIPNKRPTATMMTAFDGNQVVGDQTLVLEGAGNDLEDGSLSGNSLIWHSNLDGEIGRGETLQVNADALSEGEHVIWLEAVDSAGASSIITETVAPPALASLSAAQVTSGEHTQATDDANVNQTGAALLEVYRNRPYQAPSLDPAGFGFTLDQGKTATAILPIRNSGDGGALDWAVTATGLPSWIQLSQTSGQTPQNVVATANASGIAPGTYTGTLTFQSSQAILNKTVTVPYTVTVLAVAAPQPSSIFLPLIRR